MKKTKKLISLLSVMAFLVMALVPLTAIAAGGITATSSAGPTPGDKYSNVPSPTSPGVYYSGYEITLSGGSNYTVIPPVGVETPTVADSKFRPSLPGQYTIVDSSGASLKIDVRWSQYGSPSNGAAYENNNLFPAGADAWLAQFIPRTATYNTATGSWGGAAGTLLSNCADDWGYAGMWYASSTKFPGSDATASGTAPIDGLWINYTHNYQSDLMVNITNARANPNPIASWVDKAQAFCASTGPGSEGNVDFPYDAFAAIDDLTTGTWYVAFQCEADEGPWNNRPPQKMWLDVFEVEVTAPAPAPVPSLVDSISVVEIAGPAVSTSAPTPQTLSSGVTAASGATVIPSSDYTAELTWLDESGAAALSIVEGQKYIPQITISLSDAALSSYIFAAAGSPPVAFAGTAAINNAAAEAATNATSTEPASSVVLRGEPIAAGQPSAAPVPTLPPVSAPTAPIVAPPSVSTPSTSPSASASASASATASAEPTTEPSGEPGTEPSAEPSSEPSAEPSGAPSTEPSAAPPVAIKPDAPDAPADIEVVENSEGEGSILTGVPIGTQDETTTVETVASWIEAPEGGTVDLVDADGNPADPAAPVGTGMVIEVRDARGIVIQSTTVVVKGDVLGTGVMSLTQLVRVSEAMVGQVDLSGAYLDAADLNGDGQVTLTDLVLEARMFADSELNG